MAAYVGASILSSVVGYPFDVLKTRTQLSAKGVVNNSIGTHFNGLVCSAMRNSAFIGSKLYTYDFLCERRAPEHFADRVAYGTVSGIVGATVGTPFDVVMVHLQSASKKTDLRKTILDIYKRSGVLGLWKGYVPTVHRAMVVTGCQLGVYNQVLHSMRENTDCSHTTNMTLSCVSAGVMAAVFSNPFDVCKTRRMKSETPNTIRTVLAKESFVGLFKGLVPSMMRQVPVNMARFMVLDLYS